jgi:tetratricopeptide (TPR) repeat protein
MLPRAARPHGVGTQHMDRAARQITRRGSRMKALGRVALLLGAIALTGTIGCKTEPDAATIHREAGDRLLGKNEFKQAAEEYGQSLQADPKQEKVWEKKAYAHMQAGDMDQADTAILKTVDFKADAPAKAEVYRNLGGLYVQKGSLDKAEGYFNQALQIDPKDDQSLAWLAEIYSQRGGARDMKAEVVTAHLDKAIEYYDKVIAMKPELPNTYLNKRIVMARYMDYEKRKKEAVEREAQDSGDKAKIEAAKVEAEQHQKRMDEFKKQFDELSKKFSEATKNAKAASSATP